MAVTLNRASFRVNVDIETEVNPSELSLSRDAISQALISAFADGNGAGEAEQVWHDRRTIAGGANDDLDLAGVLTNWAGQTITFTAVKGVVVFNRSANAATILTVGATGGTWPANLWQAECGPGDPFVQMERQAGEVVTPTTADTLRITNQDGVNTATYDIFILGIE